MRGGGCGVEDPVGIGSVGNLDLWKVVEFQAGI